MTDPTTSFIKRLADGVFQAVASIDVAYYQKIRAIGSPIGPLNMFEDFPWSASDQRGAGQRSHIYPSAEGFAVEEQSHF
jgi:hypothetical protein